MTKYLATVAILLTSTVIAGAQTIVPCTGTDPSADLSGECSAAPTTGVPEQNSTGTIDEGTFGIDQDATSGLPQPTPPQGLAPLVVPNDPLGQGIDQNPLGSFSTPSGINGNGTISSPAIR
jgi:hypothetical protein